MFRGAGDDTRMLLKVAIQRGRATALRPDDQEVGEAPDPRRRHRVETLRSLRQTSRRGLAHPRRSSRLLTLEQRDEPARESLVHGDPGSPTLFEAQRTFQEEQARGASRATSPEMPRDLKLGLAVPYASRLASSTSSPPCGTPIRTSSAARRTPSGSAWTTVPSPKRRVDHRSVACSTVSNRRGYDPIRADRSPDDRSSRASADRSGPRARRPAARAVTRSLSCGRYELEENVDRSSPPSVATSKTTSELGAVPDRPQYRCGNGRHHRDRHPIPDPFEQELRNGQRTRGEAVRPRSQRRRLVLHERTRERIPPQLRVREHAPSGLMIWRTGFRFGRNCLPIDTATSTRRAHRGCRAATSPTRSIAGSTCGSVSERRIGHAKGWRPRPI